MRERAPAVFPVLRSRLTAAVLARTYIGDGEYSVADLAATSETDTGTVVIVLGPAQILGKELEGLTGVEAAAIFGSWAARVSGEPGPAPADIDLLVIGRPDRDDLHEAVGRARQKLGRDINTVTLTVDRWNADDDPFIAQVRTRPMVPLGDIPEPQDLAAVQ
ncbi:MAG TPA: hypothetical protein VMA95_01930 [Streptosporangiaceae bacterium]|nr:hypothetical protein [Streptosporangiaceae bacterium]